MNSDDNKKLVFIYTLTDPEDQLVKYVGKCKTIQIRYNQHLHEKKPTLKNNWIKGLKKRGLVPIIEVLDEVKDEEWKFWEIFWISLLKSWGFNLKNMTNGGDGGDTFSKLPEERKKIIREKLSIFSKNRKTSEETRKKMSENAKNRKYSDATRKKFSEARKRGCAEGKIYNRRQVLQFDLNNNFLKEFESLSQAERETGIETPHIHRVSKGNRLTAGGYIWKYKEGDPDRINNLNKHYTIVQQYDLNNNFLAEYKSVKEAVEKTGSSQTGILYCFRGIQKTCNGYIWKKNRGGKKISQVTLKRMVNNFFKETNKTITEEILIEKIKKYFTKRSIIFENIYIEKLEKNNMNIFKLTIDDDSFNLEI